MTRHGGDRLVVTELAALAAGVSEATIRKWASRGRITRYGSPGKAQYDLDELLVIRQNCAAGTELTETPQEKTAQEFAELRGGMGEVSPPRH